ncbi:MAG: hypothetical protein IH984_01820 [Planctomycetes bacterium]|nr:hypothetical protein [Planctomycetota bacterium]
MWFKSSFTIPAVAAISFCLIGGTAPAAADILHVPGDYPTIQEAIDTAVDGDEVEVHPGTYNETINFLGKAIRVYSTDGPDVTIIDAQQTGTVVTCFSAEGPDTVLDGFTITGGISGNGGGMRNINSSPTVINCTFSGNSAGGGGGMYNVGGSSPTVSDCSFSQNTAADGWGGGMLNTHGASPIVTNCTFSGNTANFGGGMFSGDYKGGAFPTVTNCTFVGNSADVGGGGMCNDFSSSTVTNCTFTGNTAGSVGGGMYNSYYSTTVTNCTFSGNSAGDGGGMANVDGSDATVTNCILWGDSPNEFSGSGTSTVGYSNVQGGFTGDGNIDADPLFVDPGIGDYRLSSGSPAIDAGNNWGVPIDENDYDDDGVLCELFPVDLDGNPRFNADESDFDPGCGVPVVVDMGAYEYQFDPVEQITFADITGDGAVSTLDLLSLFADWGECAKGCCLADLDLDGFVNTIDLLLLFANWGACK